jgi:hypothetical protein
MDAGGDSTPQVATTASAGFRAIVMHRGVQATVVLWVVGYLLVFWIAGDSLPFDRPAVAAMYSLEAGSSASATPLGSAAKVGDDAMPRIAVSSAAVGVTLIQTKLRRTILYRTEIAVRPKKLIAIFFITRVK